MKKSLSLLLLSTFILAACGGPATVQYGSATLTYDSGTWTSFSNDMASGLNVKGDESCWIDLKGDLTKPTASESLTQDATGAVTYYSDPSTGQPHYVSFVVGTETVYARVSVENPESCVGNIEYLISDTLGE